MHDASVRRIQDLRAILAGFERTNNSTIAPGAQDSHDEFRGAAVRKTDWILQSGALICGLEQLAKGPSTGRSDVEKRKFLAVGVREATPTVVEHCQLPTPPLGWIASSNDGSSQDFR